MSDESLFQKMDELERIYAPDQLPIEEQDRVRADEGSPRVTIADEPVPGPIATIGTSPSGMMAQPGVAEVEEPGEPENLSDLLPNPLDADEQARRSP